MKNIDDIDDVPELEDLTRDISLLVSIAKVDAALHDHTGELERIPARIAAFEKKIAQLDASETKAVSVFEAMKKEHRALEQGLQDAEQQIVKYKGQLMAVKTNKEYTAMLKEIEGKEREIEQMEERLLELMDAVEANEETHAAQLGKIGAERDQALAEKAKFEERQAHLESESRKLMAEKPKLLSEVEPVLRKRYQRLFTAHGDLAVTRTEGEHCAGCGTQLPPQLVVEVKKNTQLITCQSCGRILIDYS